MRRRASFTPRAVLVASMLSFFACEGTSFRCDPSPSWSYAPPEGDASSPSFGPPPACTASSCLVSALAAGARHTCARAIGGETPCWGDNTHGQSDPRALDRMEVLPTFVVTGTAASRRLRNVALGAAHTCIDFEGGVRCWGAERVVGAASGRVVDIEIGGPATWLSSGSLHACAHRAEIRDDGVFVVGEGSCFGAWDGVDPARTSASPTPVPGGRLYAAAFRTCAISFADLDGIRTQCWGGVPPAGRLAPGAWVRTEEVALGERLLPWVFGAEHDCAQQDAELECRGRGDRGQLGNGGRAGSEDWVRVEGLPPRPVEMLCTGGQGALRVEPDDVLAAPPSPGFTCAIVLGRVWCWGANDRGQLGDGTREDRAVATPVLGLDGANANDLTCGEAHACVRIVDAIYCWGDNRYGQLGVPSSELGLSPLPIRVELFPEE